MVSKNVNVKLKFNKSTYPKVNGMTLCMSVHVDYGQNMAILFSSTFKIYSSIKHKIRCTILSYFLSYDEKYGKVAHLI